MIGSTGALGTAFCEQLESDYPHAKIHKFSSKLGNIDYSDEASIEVAAKQAAEDGPIDMVLVATGMLHDGALMPEKSLRDLSAEKFQKIYAANTIFPAMAAKYFLPKIAKDTPAIFAAISARVGSVSDNRLGGWYAYRASKAALNMVIKNAAIEMGRRYDKAIIVGLHPGTVDSELSKPFQSQVKEGKLFTPEYSAAKMLEVLSDLSADDSGKCFAWDAAEIAP